MYTTPMVLPFWQWPMRSRVGSGPSRAFECRVKSRRSQFMDLDGMPRCAEMFRVRFASAAVSMAPSSRSLPRIRKSGSSLTPTRRVALVLRRA